jgi:hypothetical protein
MRKRLRESKYFRLSCENRKDPNKRGKGHRYYTITWHNWRLPVEAEEQVRDIVDPKRNISGKRGSTWAFKKLEDAEKRYTMLLLKWG